MTMSRKSRSSSGMVIGISPASRSMKPSSSAWRCARPGPAGLIRGERSFDPRSGQTVAPKSHAGTRRVPILAALRDYLDEQRFPLVHCPAIVVFDFGSGSSREMKGAFQFLRTMYGSPQFFDKWVKIDAKRDCWSEYWRFLNGTTSRSRYRVHRGRLQEWVET